MTDDVHDWVEFTTLSDPTLVYLCADPWCDEVRRAPRPPTPPMPSGPQYGWLPGRGGGTA